MVPFSKSRLTQMYKTILISNTETGISMTINVNMSPNVFKETMCILLMSAITKKIISKPRTSLAIDAANNSKNKIQDKSKEGNFIMIYGFFFIKHLWK